MKLFLWGLAAYFAFGLYKCRYSRSPLFCAVGWGFQFGGSFPDATTTCSHGGLLPDLPNDPYRIPGCK